MEKCTEKKSQLGDRLLIQNSYESHFCGDEEELFILAFARLLSLTYSEGDWLPSCSFGAEQAKNFSISRFFNVFSLRWWKVSFLLLIILSLSPSPSLSLFCSLSRFLRQDTLKVYLKFFLCWVHNSTNVDGQKFRLLLLPSVGNDEKGVRARSEGDKKLSERKKQVRWDDKQEFGLPTSVVDDRNDSSR